MKVSLKEKNKGKLFSYLEDNSLGLSQTVETRIESFLSANMPQERKVSYLWLKYAISALITSPDKIIYFPIWKTSDRYLFPSYDAVLTRVELLTICCRECGRCLWRENNAGSDALSLCRPYYEDYYTACVRCGGLIRENETYYEYDDDFDERSYCSNCFHSLGRSDRIYDYYNKPDPISHGAGPRYFGVELELDCGGESAANAVELLNVANAGGEHTYVKHDGSLEEGLEVVTHPMSLEYQLDRMPWEALGRKQYGKVYLSLGVNELGYYNDQAFYDAYCRAVDAIRACQPNAVIYIQGLIPLNEDVIADTGGASYLTNEHLLVYNGLMKRVAEGKQVVFLDLNPEFTGPDGQLPAEASKDGVHLTKAYCQQWLDYLKAHTVNYGTLCHAS